MHFFEVAFKFHKAQKPVWTDMMLLHRLTIFTHKTHHSTCQILLRDACRKNYADAIWLICHQYSVASHWSLFFFTPLRGYKVFFAALSLQGVDLVSDISVWVPRGISQTPLPVLAGREMAGCRRNRTAGRGHTADSCRLDFSTSAE